MTTEISTRTHKFGAVVKGMLTAPRPGYVCLAAGSRRIRRPMRKFKTVSRGNNGDRLTGVGRPHPDAKFSDGDTEMKILLRTDIDELPVAGMDGYEFLGWYSYTDGQYVDLAFVKGMAEYREFTAMFTPLITFDPNGGVVIVGNSEYRSPYTIGQESLREYSLQYYIRLRWICGITMRF